MAFAKTRLSVLISILLVVIVASSGWLLLSEMPVSASLVGSNVRMVEIATSSPYTIVSGSYPQFSNAPADFNAKITNVLVRAVEEQSISSSQNWQARYETAIPSEHTSRFPAESERFPLTVRSSIVRNDADVISVLLQISEYTGGAHGQTVFTAFNYSLRDDKEITLRDLMKGDAQFLQKLSREARAQLRTILAHDANVAPDMVDESMVEDGTTPNAQNFSVFTLPSDTDAIFYFNEYQVAAYAFGTPQIHVTLPIK